MTIKLFSQNFIIKILRKAMDRLDRVMSVITITVGNVIKKIITKKDPRRSAMYTEKLKFIIFEKLPENIFLEKLTICLITQNFCNL